MRLEIPLAFLLAHFVSAGVQAQAGTWVDSVSTPAFQLGASGARNDVVRVMLRDGARIAEIAARGEDVKAFGDSAAALLARPPGRADLPTRRLTSTGAMISLSYGRSQGGDVIEFTLGPDGAVVVHPSLDDTRRILGILRGASFWGMEQSHGQIAKLPHPMISSRPGFPPDSYMESRVDRQPKPLAGNKPPVFPPLLKSAKVEGSVYAQFVVDTLGKVDMTTFRVLKSTHDLFTNAVKQALAGYSFRPGMIGGHKVKTLVQMPFDFPITP
jgi:hypothetical protein